MRGFLFFFSLVFSLFVWFFILFFYYFFLLIYIFSWGWGVHNKYFFTAFGIYVIAGLKLRHFLVIEDNAYPVSQLIKLISLCFHYCLNETSVRRSFFLWLGLYSTWTICSSLQLLIHNVKKALGTSLRFAFLICLVWQKRLAGIL